MAQFIIALKHYIVEIFPALVLGFFLSGLIHELVPDSWVEKHLGKKGIKPIFYATIVGTVLPICCWGFLPVAISFYKKGSRLGSVLAFLVATPATSVTALLVTFKLLGLKFTIFLFFSVILMGLIMGTIGNFLTFEPRIGVEHCSYCAQEVQSCVCERKVGDRIKSIFKFAFVDMVREIGPEMLLGIILAAFVASFVPLGRLINTYLAAGWGYLFALIFGLITYICSTATVPLVDAFIVKGMSVGAGMVLLLVGPITSYGTILVMRKEFGAKILFSYLVTVSTLSLILGYSFSLIH
ncbi:MAG: permease [Actinomycetota bacterium]|nr:permease [Actinomycetota bacterium]